MLHLEQLTTRQSRFAVRKKTYGPFVATWTISRIYGRTQDALEFLFGQAITGLLNNLSIPGDPLNHN